ncbi:MAG TPA: hypothetical protein VK846_00680 [Candidatus Limnocylindria bacterium]|nr:hypothetical protein [Candidatus Limnocylindria bacterium]
MGAKFKRPIVVINSVAPGRTATARVEVGRRINKVVLHVTATGQVANQIIDTITVKVAGKPQRTFTPDELQAMYLLMGEAGSTQYGIQNNVAGQQIDIPLWFREPWRKGYQTSRIMGWATGDVKEDEFVIEIKVLGSADASTSISASVEYDNPMNNGVALAMGEISKWYEEDIEVTGLTKTYPLPKFDSLQSISLNDSNITKVELIVGDVTVREIFTQENSSDLTGDGMTPSATWFHLVLDNDDDSLSAIPLQGQKNGYLKLTLNDGTPRNIRALIQRIGPRD